MPSIDPIYFLDDPQIKAFVKTRRVDLTATGEVEILSEGRYIVYKSRTPPGQVEALGAHQGEDVALHAVLPDQGGRQAQAAAALDLGHLAAHLDLAALARRIPKGLSMTFLAAYGPLSAEDARITAVHHAAELLARSVGAFPRPDLDDTARRDAVLHAVVLLRAAQAAAGAAPGAPPTPGPRGR